MRFIIKGEGPMSAESDGIKSKQAMSHKYLWITYRDTFTVL